MKRKSPSLVKRKRMRLRVSVGGCSGGFWKKSEGCESSSLCPASSLTKGFFFITSGLGAASACVVSSSVQTPQAWQTCSVQLPVSSALIAFSHSLTSHHLCSPI